MEADEATKPSGRGLRESEETVRALLNASPDSAMLFDLQGTFLALNRVAAERLGKRVNELLGACAYDLFPAELAHFRRSQLQQVVRSGKPVRFEEQRDGMTFNSTCYPIFDAQGKVERVAVIAKDVTEHRRAEEAAQREQQRLRRLLEMHERDRKFMAYEIHDGFVQPLTAALMHLEGSLPDVRDRCPDTMRRGCETALGLLRRGISEARRLMSGLRPVILDEFGLIAAIDNLVYTAQQSSNLEVEYRHNFQSVRLAPPLETAIFRIAQETLNNAVRHSRSDRVRVELLQQGDRIRLEVQDWGIGFDPQSVQEHHFGLEGIRERAQIFGGHATIDSAPGEGTRVTVELPRVEDAPRGTENPRQP